MKCISLLLIVDVILDDSLSSWCWQETVYWISAVTIGTVGVLVFWIFLDLSRSHFYNSSLWLPLESCDWRCEGPIVNSERFVNVQWSETNSKLNVQRTWSVSGHTHCCPEASQWACSEHAAPTPHSVSEHGLNQTTQLWFETALCCELNVVTVQGFLLL